MIDSITKSTDQKYWLEAYAQYLKNVRNLTFNTRRRYLFVVGKLLHGLSPDGQIDSTKFSPDAICAFVTREAEARIGAGKRSCTSPVRSFLRFLVGQGVLRQGTESVIPRVRFREENRLPKYLTEQEVRDILKVSVQQSSRNYAVLLLLSRLGLRAHEVSGLLLSDIEWTNGSLVIRGKKTHCRRLLPLSKELADALVIYLREGRPSTSHRQVFIQNQAPFKPLTAGAITKVVARILQKSQISPRTRCCSHVFRHTVATQMVNRGVTFKDIADLLGHESLQTTAMYAKLDLKTLSQIALPWPGGKQ